MSAGWLVVLVVGAVTVVFKAAGPVFLGRHPLPPRAQAVVDLLAPVLLTAFVVTQTFEQDAGIEVDARVPGVLAGGVALALRAPLLAAMVIGAVVTAVVRLAG